MHSQFLPGMGDPCMIWSSLVIQSSLSSFDLVANRYLFVVVSICKDRKSINIKATAKLWFNVVSLTITMYTWRSLYNTGMLLQKVCSCYCKKCVWYRQGLLIFANCCNLIKYTLKGYFRKFPVDTLKLFSRWIPRAPVRSTEALGAAGKSWAWLDLLGIS